MSDERSWEPELETLPRPLLEKLQLKRLQEHLQLAYSKSPYYRNAFDAASIKPSDLKRLEDLQRFPFTDKKIERDRS